MLTNEQQNMIDTFNRTTVFFAEDVTEVLPNRIISFFDRIFKDNDGNIHFIKNGTGKKVQILFRCNPIGAILGKKSGEKFFIHLLGEKKPEDLLHTILYQKDTEVGAICLDENKKPCIKPYLDFSKNIKEILCVKNEVSCEADMLYGVALSSVYPLIILDYISYKCFGTEKQITFTLWNESLTAQTGGISACKSCGADVLVVISGIKSQDGCLLSKGPAGVLKDGSYVAGKGLQNLMKDKLSQMFVGKTDRFLEQVSVRCGCENLLGIYLPVSREKSGSEKMDYKDIEKLGKILLQMMEQLW